jgi:ribosomal protein S18 acetylase RimI-like enzyme
MIIRKAKVEDSKVIATLMLLAMKEIVYQFIGLNSIDKATQFLENLINQKANQYSYENCWVLENKEGIVAVANIYDGAKLQELRTPVIKLLKSMFNRNFSPEDETKEGELYIDCIGVSPDQQGKGIGTKIFQFLINEYPNKPLGLLVDKDNPDAKKLYLKLGFEIIEEMTFAGKEMEHLQLRNKNQR